MPVVSAREGCNITAGRVQESSVCTHTLNKQCPAFLHVFMCDSSSKTQPEADHGEQHTVCFQRHQETSHQDFLRRQWYGHGPEELGDRRIILFPPQKCLEILYGPELLTHTINSFSLMGLYFWKRGAQDIGLVYILTAASVNFHFLLVNQVETALGSGRS